MISRLTLAATAGLLLAFVLSACTAAPQGDPTETPAQPPASAEPTEEPEEPVATTQPGADPTCESIVTPGTVESLTAVGWTYEQQEFRIGEFILDEGLYCVWGDYTVASDHVQVYGWAPIDAAMSSEAQAYLISQGWLREAADEGIYITEDPALALSTDDDGYGMTYLFGDGWVIVSDTKQGLLLIEQR